MDRDADAPGHDALLAEAEAERLDELGRDAPLVEVRVRRIKGEGKAERLVAAFGSAALPGALPGPPEARGDAVAGVDGPFLCFWAGRPVLGLPSPLAHVRRAKFDAADLGEQDARAPERDGFPVPVLHPVHELEHVAGRLAGEAVVDPLAEVHRAAGLFVGMEGAPDFHLVALPHRRKAVVGEDGAEVRALPKIIEVNASIVCHGATATVSYSQQ